MEMVVEVSRAVAGRVAVMVACALVLAAGACGGDAEPLTGFADVAGADDGTPVELTGFVMSLAGDVRVCELLAESFPPQCGGASVPVDGLVVERLEGWTVEQSTGWTPSPVTVTGIMAAGRIDAS